MNVSKISNGSILGKALRLPLKLIPAKTVIPVLQGNLKGKKWVSGASIHGCWLGSYEADKQQLFAETITSGSVVFDLGANVGFYTLLAAEIVGTTGKVYAFEPVPRNLNYLYQHIELNHLNNVVVIDAAVSDHAGFAFFDEGPSNSMGALANSGKLKVKTVVLDEMLAKGELPPPDYIKIDIEGGELFALQGAKNTLVAYKPTIFLATHGKAIHLECCKFLKELDYTLVPIGGSKLEEVDELIASNN